MPRPRTNPELHRQNVALTLPPTLINEARSLAAIRGQSLSQQVERLLQDWVDSATDEELQQAIDLFIAGHEKRILLIGKEPKLDKSSR
jgi:hypothetical protein